MKAVRLVDYKSPLQLQEIPIPEIGDNDILVRVKAAGICHSDAHYREGISPADFLPITLGHEVAGVVEKIGVNVSNVRPGDRVCLHYLATCGNCMYCNSGQEQFCSSAQMISHNRDGGFAEYIAVPSKNAILLPDEIPFEQGATLMCASATSFHALLKARIKPGDTVAVFGLGGLGQSAVQLAKACGATRVFGVDINTEKLISVEKYGVITINGKAVDPIEEIKKLNNGKGVDIALELIGLPLTQKQAIQATGPLGRVVLVGLSHQPIQIDTYRDILANETEIIGSNDHHLHELPILLDYVKSGDLNVGNVVSQTIPLEADAINKALDAMSDFENNNQLRTVIIP